MEQPERRGDLAPASNGLSFGAIMGMIDDAKR